MINEPTSQDQQIEPSNKRWPLRLVISVVVLSLVSWFSWPTVSQWLDAIPSVEKDTLQIDTVTKADFLRDVAVSGRVIAANSPNLYSTEAGEVTLIANAGDSVKQGQVVAHIDSPSLTAEINQATATLAKFKIDAARGSLADNEAQLELERRVDTATVRLNASKRELKRAQLSHKKLVISEIDFVTIEDAHLEAQLLFTHAKKRVALAKKRLEFEQQTRQFSIKSQQLILDELTRRQTSLQIKSPVDGVIGGWLVQQKERVAPSTAIMSVVDLSHYQAQLLVPEFYADDLGLGLSVEISIGALNLTGEISSISPEVISNQVMVRVNLPLTKALDRTKNQRLRQNQRLNARIAFEQRTDVLTLKRGGFLSAQGGRTAFVVRGEHAHLVDISVGAQSSQRVEILTGLQPGDQVIISDHGDYLNHPTIKLVE